MNKPRHTITIHFSIPKELHARVKEHADVNWSAVVRTAIKKELIRLAREKKIEKALHVEF